MRLFRSYGIPKSGASHKWFDESSRLIKWFLHCDSDLFGLTTSLLCIFDIYWVSTAVVLVKNDVLFLVPTGKVLELGFLICNLMKAWLSVERLLPVKRIWEMTKNLGAHPAWLLNPTISKFWHSSYMVITCHNLKILLSLLLLSHPTISNFYQPANWNFFGIVIPLNYNYYY